MSVKLKCNSIRTLNWDSEFWGFPIATFEGDKLCKESLKKSNSYCYKENISCLYFLANGSDPKTLKFAYENGFKFVDVRIEMELVTSSLTCLKKNTDIRSVVKKEDLDSIKAIARKSHTESRFFKDLNFERRKCKIFYEKWIERDFDLGTILGFYPDCEKIARGYITVTSESPSNARIGLLAVEDDYRGKGTAFKLLEEAIATSIKKGVEKLVVTTQGTNKHALSLYEKIGFRTSNVTIWFHKWFNHR